MELQFDVECKTSIANFFDSICIDSDDVGIMSYAVSKDRTITSCKKYSKFTFTVPNENISKLIMEEVLGRNMDDTISIANLRTDNNGMVIFNVHVKVNFYDYNPDILWNLTNKNNGGIIKEMKVLDGKSKFDNNNNSVLKCAISPFNINFVRIAHVLKNKFDIHITCGNSMIALPRGITHVDASNLNHIDVRMKFKEDHHKNILKELKLCGITV